MVMTLHTEKKSGRMAVLECVALLDCPHVWSEGTERRGHIQTSREK
jgi:hypothetical protein